MYVWSHGQPFLHQQANQFGDNHGGVGIVDLYRYILVQVSQVAAPLFGLLQNQLSGAAYQEVLLVHSQ